MSFENANEKKRHAEVSPIYYIDDDIDEEEDMSAEDEKNSNYFDDLPVIGVRLRLPLPAFMDEAANMKSKSSADNTKEDMCVILLCTQVDCPCIISDNKEDEEEDTVLEVDGTEVKELDVSKVIFETPPSASGKHVLIFQCVTSSSDDAHQPKTLCLKLMDCNDIYRSEKRAYEQMMKKSAVAGGGAASDMFLKVHFFCEVIMPDKRVWKGYGMEEGKYSLRDIFYSPTSDPISGAQEQKKIFADILQDKEKALVQQASFQPAMRYFPPMTITSKTVCEEDARGVKVEFLQTQSIQMSIAIAALRLLHQLHTVYGWVHGDSHLGNFMYMNQRVYAIDFERSFSSSDSVQHLMDVQEFFGHFSGIILHSVRCNDWDMRDIFGLYYYRHPLVKKEGKEDMWVAKSSNFSRRKTLFMLPVCTCFTCPTEEMRVKGCPFCKSGLNVESARFMAVHFEDVMQDLKEWGLSKMKNGLNHTRSVTIANQCTLMVDLIYPYIQDGSVLTMKTVVKREGMTSCRRVRRRVEVDEKSSSLNSKLIAEMTRGKQGCFTVLKRLLYMPVISKQAHRMIKEIATRLSDAGFNEAADTLWANVASPQV